MTDKVIVFVASGIPSNRKPSIMDDLFEAAMRTALKKLPNEWTYQFMYSSTPKLSDINRADLVVADVTPLRGAPNVLYHVGLRQGSGKPMIIISDISALPRRTAVWDLLPAGVVYRRDDLGASLNPLSDAILRHLMNSHVPTSIPANNHHLAVRVAAIADAISDLRINSLAEQVQQLRDISDELSKVDDTPHPDAVNDLTEKILLVLAQIDRVVGSSRLGKLMLSGALAALVTGGGLAAAAVFSLSIAVWEGPEYFRAALDKYLQGKKAAPAKSARRRSSSLKASASGRSQQSSRLPNGGSDKME